MPAAKRIKALQAILRASQYDVDQLAAQLSHIRGQEQEIQQRMCALDERRDRESYSPSLEAQPFVMSFLEAIGKEQLHLSRKLAELEKTSSDLELKMREKFLERERWKATQKKAQELMSYDEQLIENRIMDEVAALHFENAGRT